MKHIGTTNEEHPENMIERISGEIKATGKIGEPEDRNGIGWARYAQPDGKDCLAIWREIQIEPDGVDYDVLLGAMADFGRINNTPDLMGWGRNIADLDRAITAHYQAMNAEERAEHEAML